MIRDLAGVSTEVDADIQGLEAVAHPRRDSGSSPFTTAWWSSAAALAVLVEPLQGLELRDREAVPALVTALARRARRPRYRRVVGGGRAPG